MKRRNTIVGLLGMLVVALVVTLSMVIVLRPATGHRSYRSVAAAIAAANNQRYYGVSSVTGQRLGVYLDQLTAGPSPACTW